MVRRLPALAATRPDAEATRRRHAPGWRGSGATPGPPSAATASTRSAEPAGL